MTADDLIAKSEPFLHYVAAWEANLPDLPLASLSAEPGRLALVSVDVINGFCYAGPLASPRIQGIIAPIVDLFERAHAAGVRRLVLVQEAHEHDAVEFGSYPRHAVRGTEEAQAVPEIQVLPFFSEMTVIGKNSIHPAHNTRFDEWLQTHPEVETFLCLGDCTDLCTYQLAMHLRLRANAHQLRHRIIVPANCTQTYDLPVAAAEPIGAVPHAGDLLHTIFLYSMHLNGVEIVRAIT
jgi:nicotinamidase-related amidase